MTTLCSPTANFDPAAAPDAAFAAVPAVPAVPDLFVRLVALYRGNQRLLTELAGLRVRISRVREYRESPGCNPALAAAQLDRLKTRHAAALAVLRANRVEARLLLARSAEAPLV